MREMLEQLCGAAGAGAVSYTHLDVYKRQIYWMAGLSTIGSISLGRALVIGSTRVPRPAAGITAFLTF